MFLITMAAETHQNLVPMALKLREYNYYLMGARPLILKSGDSAN
jgi:hypothetical protein